MRVKDTFDNSKKSAQAQQNHDYLCVYRTSPTSPTLASMICWQGCSSICVLCLSVLLVPGFRNLPGNFSFRPWTSFVVWWVPGLHLNPRTDHTDTSRLLVLFCCRVEGQTRLLRLDKLLLLMSVHWLRARGSRIFGFQGNRTVARNQSVRDPDYRSLTLYPNKQNQVTMDQLNFWPNVQSNTVDWGVVCWGHFGWASFWNPACWEEGWPTCIVVGGSPGYWSGPWLGGRRI